MPLSLTNEQWRALEDLPGKRTLKQGHSRRVRVVLLAADDVPGVEITRRVGLPKFQVSRIRGRFVEPKPGRGNNVPLATVAGSFRP